MDDWRSHRGGRATERRLVGAFAVVAAMVLLAGQGVSQTLTKPNPPSKPSVSPSAGAAKPARIGRTKSCSDYGDGFVYVPASDTCVKVGGYVRFDAGVNR
jgi:hypothetical protein